MFVAFHADSRQWLLKSESPQDGTRIKALPLKAWSTFMRGWLIPEIAWQTMAGWAWPAGQDPFGRYRNGTLPEDTRRREALLPFLGHLPFQPLEFQWGGIERLIGEKRLLLGDEQGLGKTVQTLMAYEVLQRRGLAGCLVVICPLRKIQDWRDEFERFLGRPPATHELYVFNYEKTHGRHYKEPGKQVRSTGANDIAVEALNALQARRGVLAIDEIHLTAKVHSKRHQAIACFVRASLWAWGLSGTLVPNRAESFYHPYRLITGAAVTLSEFVKFFCYTTRDRVTGYNKERLKALRGVFNVVGLARLTEEVHELPPAVRVPIRIRLTGRQKDLYNSMREEWKVTLQSMTDREYKVTARSVLPHMTRLLQIASHPGLLGDAISEDVLAKVQVMDELLAEAGPHKKIVIWDVYPAVLDRFAVRYAAEYGAISLHGQTPAGRFGADRKRFLTDPTCRVACCSLLAMGEGQNLQAASVAIFHGLGWRYEKIAQAMKRIHRIGQAERCAMYFLLGADTIEEYVFKTAQEKHGFQKLITGKAEDWDFNPEALPRSVWLSLLSKPI